MELEDWCPESFKQYAINDCMVFIIVFNHWKEIAPKKIYEKSCVLRVKALASNNLISCDRRIGEILTENVNEGHDENRTQTCDHICLLLPYQPRRMLNTER